MNYLVFIKKIKFIALVLVLMGSGAYSQDAGNKLYELLQAYETTLNFTPSGEGGFANMGSFNNLFFNQGSLVVNDIADNRGSKGYLSVGAYARQLNEKFKGEVIVRLYNLEISDIVFFENYLVYKVSVKKSIVGETKSGEFFNRNFDLVFEVARFYSGDDEKYKILKISPENEITVYKEEIKQPLVSGIELYLSSGKSSMKYSDNAISAGDYSGFSSNNEFSLKIGGNILFDLFSGKKMSYQIGTGISYTAYKSTLGLESYKTGIDATDKDDDDYFRVISGSNFQQNIKLNYLDFPLFLQTNFHLADFNLYLKAGLQIGFATNKLLNTSGGEVNYKGEYLIVDHNGVTYDFVMEDFDEYGFGTYDVNQSEQELDISPVNLSLLLGAGVSYPLNKSFSLTGGIDFVSGLTDNIVNNSTSELISDNNVNSIITSSTSFKTGFIGFDFGVVYKFNKPSKPIEAMEGELLIADYVSPHTYDTTAFSNEKGNDFTLASDFSGFNIFYLDLSDEALNRAKVKDILQASLDSVDTQSGNHFVFVSNFNDPIVVGPGDSYGPVMKQLNFITPDLPDVEKDIAFILESLDAQKNIRKASRANLFLFLSSSFYKYQSRPLIEKLEDYLINRDIQVYIYLDGTIATDIELDRYNYKYININKRNK